MKINFILLTVLLCLILACNSSLKQDVAFHKELHTYSNFMDVRTTHLIWDAKVDFDKKKIFATATWHFNNPKNLNRIVFDSHNLDIDAVEVGGRNETFYLGKHDDEYGAALVIPIQSGDTILRITYSTSSRAAALQWLAPSQTAGKKLPYLFTQCEPVQARSIIPCQDAPANRITYDATVKVPTGMMALMSAKNPTAINETGIYTFQTELPIPTYLIALAVGDIAYSAIDERTGVYTEPSMLSAAAAELSDIPTMMKAAEAIGGPYRWGKYDVLIAPPSFPIGGMENPRLTFATPTILAGDKSLVSLIAHEMAHSWSGNLVTNARWHDLWLNEGFTTYFERRIMESLSGKAYTDMLWEIGYQDLQSDLTSLGDTNQDTRLKLNLTGRNPDAAFSNIPYEKGAYFLKMLEENIGRKKFDVFLNNYFNTFTFKPTTTEDCMAYMTERLFDYDTLLQEKLMIKQWVYGTGLPANCPHQMPSRFAQVDAQRAAFEQSNNAKVLKTATWSTHEWLHFLRKLPHPMTLTALQSLDSLYKLTNTGNSEIANEWFKHCIASKYKQAYTQLEIFLSKVGRKKFLEPLYSEMAKTDEGKKMALKIFNKHKDNYHPLTAAKISEVLK